MSLIRFGTSFLGAIRVIGDIFTAHQVGTNLPVTTKKMSMDEQPEEYLINDILVMRASHHANMLYRLVPLQEPALGCDGIYGGSHTYRRYSSKLDDSRQNRGSE